MTIIGVDTSLRSTGFAVITQDGSRPVALEYGNIHNARTLPLSACLSKIFDKISELIEKYSPDAVSVESVIYAKNAGTMLLLGQARGAVITAAARAGINVFEYEPRRMKRAVCGNAMAEKDQICHMVKVLFSLNEVPQNDAADALGLALCHLNSRSSVLKEEPI